VLNAASAEYSKLSLLVAILACVLLLSFVFLHAGAAAGQGEEWMEEVVTTGDTLWSLAAAHAPRGRDIRSYIDEIIRVNGLNGPIIYPGQTLRMPR
jgi:hypothetical protein